MFDDLEVLQPELLRLARRLVQDEASAEDLVQRTWLRALSAGVDGIRRPIAWLAAILRNEWRRDVEARGLEAVPLPREELADRATPDDAIHRYAELLREVEALPEELRRVVSLRYFEGLPPRRIAERVGAPVRTVDSRLYRARVRLRERLDRKYGSRDRWVGTWFPLIERSRATAALRWTGLAGAAAVVATVATIALAGRPGGGETAQRLGASLDAPPSPALEDGDGPPSRRVPAAPPADPPAAPEPARLLHAVRVVDATGRPVPDATLRVRDVQGRIDVELGRTDRDGRLALEVAEFEPDLFYVPAAREDTGKVSGRALVVVEDPNWASRRGVLTAGLTEPGRATTLVAYPTRALAGRVVSTEGGGLPGSLRIAWSDDAERHAADAERTRERHWVVRTDDEAAFEVTRMPDADGILAHVARAGHRRVAERLPRGTHLDLAIALRPNAVGDGPLGVLVDPDGRPVAGDVAVDGNWVTARPDGSFPLVRERGPVEWIAAYSPDWAPVGVAAPRLARDEEGRVVVRFTSAPRELRGRLLDADGEPARGFVRVEDPTFFYFGPCRGPRSVEYLPANTSGNASAGDDHLTVSVDAEGRWTIPNLADRPYSVRGYFSDTLACTPAVRARPALVGDGEAASIELRPGGDDVVRSLAIRVLDEDGGPLAGVRVRVAAVGAPMSLPPKLRRFVGADRRRWRSASALFETDADGRATFESLAAGARPSFRVDRHEVLAVEPPEPTDEVTLRVAPLCRVRVDRAVPEGERRVVYFEDAAGDELPCWTVVPLGWGPRWVRGLPLEEPYEREVWVSRRCARIRYDSPYWTRQRRSDAEEFLVELRADRLNVVRH